MISWVGDYADRAKAYPHFFNINYVDKNMSDFPKRIGDNR